MKKALTRREFATAMNFYATSFGKPTSEVPKKRELRHSTEPTEHQLQCRVVSWWNKWHEQFNLPVFALYAVPNGGSRGDTDKARMVRGVQLKAEGVRPGIPDLQMDVAREQFHGLRIEMKRKGGKVSPEQEDVHRFLEAQGYLCVVCYSDEDAVKVIKAYLDNVELPGADRRQG